MFPRSLSDIHGALRAGGILAFDSRNPRVRGWDAWADANLTTRPTSHGPLRGWLEVSEPAPGRVTLTFHNEFENSGDDVVDRLTLAFRERALIESQLTDAGFTVEAVWGGRDRVKYTDQSPVMIFQARRE